MKIGIVGSGFVGSTAAYALIVAGIGREIVLVDKDPKRAHAEANDLRHAVPFAHPLTVHDGGYEDLQDSRVVIVAAGVSQKPGESRLDLLKRNAEVFRQVIPAVVTNAPEAIIVVATNPLDIMTYLAAYFASENGVPASRVLGSGTMLDTARFRSLLGRHVGVDAHHIHGYVIGEHGDSEVLTWSLVTVGSMHLDEFCRQQGLRVDDEIRGRITDDVRNAAYTIIEGKGATYYGVGSALAKIADVILHDQRSLLTVSTPCAGSEGISDVSISLPRVVGGQGVLYTLNPPLDNRETDALRHSTGIIREAIASLQDFL
ncbi:MAG: L-lactate dehydrogenase [Deltaproteobacteria bacterium]|nr:L-lactate dehydrogenase [Deltaproteobacteria bacterium]